MINALRQHFVPQRNEVFERYVFNTAFQEPGESVDSFVTRLRKLAVTCNFKTTNDSLSYEDNMIRDRLILGTSDLETRARTFRERELDLGKIICMLKTNEVASQQLRTISDQVTDGATVNLARKMSDRKDTLSQKNCVEYFVASLSSVPKSITTVLKMRDSGRQSWCTVECQLDTGATCNVMSKDDFFRVTGKCDLCGMPSSSARLRLYDGSVIKPLGQYTFEVQRIPGLCLTFQIVNSRQKPLLSADTCQKCQNLGLITINSVSEVTQPASSDPVINEYSDVFLVLAALMVNII